MRRLLLALAAVVAPVLAQAQSFSRPLQLLVSFPPGGATDLLARAVAQAMGAELGQSVAVINRDGGAGSVGAAALAQARPDGYTLGFTTSTSVGLQPYLNPSLPYRLNSFTPICQTFELVFALAVAPESPYRTAADLAAAARARPGQLNVGVPGLGSSQHLTSELVLRAAGNLRVTHVPYRGGGPLLQDLVAGNVDAATVTFAAGAQQANAGQLVALAVTSASRQASFPKVPTIAETIAPSFEQATWMGFFAPKGTPEEIRRRLHEAAVASLKDAGVVARLRDLGFKAVGGEGTGFARLLDETVKTFDDLASERQIAAGD